MERRQASAWTLAGIGCAALLAASVVAFIVFLVVGQRMARSVRVQTADSALRRARVQELLRATELPDGYAPALGVTVPLLGRVAVLEGPATVSAADDAAARRKLFLYLEHARANKTGEWSEDLDRLLDVRGLEIERGEPLAGGTLVEGDRNLVYRTIRARLKGRPRGEWPVLAALVDVRCPDGAETVRFGAWLEPDPAPGWSAEEVDLAGTPADPEAVRRFMSHFRLCR
jgi:hypothetical protein